MSLPTSLEGETSSGIRRERSSARVIWTAVVVTDSSGCSAPRAIQLPIRIEIPTAEPPPTSSKINKVDSARSTTVSGVPTCIRPRKRLPTQIVLVTTRR